MTVEQAQAVVEAFRVATIANDTLDHRTIRYLYSVVSTEGLRAALTSNQKTYLNTLTSLHAEPFV